MRFGARGPRPHALARKQRQKLAQTARVADVLASEPTSARLPDAETQVDELSGVMGVRGDRHEYALVLGHAAILVDEIEPFRLRAQLELNALRFRLAHDLEHVDVKSPTLANQPLVRLGEHRRVRI